MRSTMQSPPLLISAMLRHGTGVHGEQMLYTWTGEGARELSFADLGRQAAQLAHALRGLGITGDDRVATFMWNNTEHVTAYLAVPSMGAVLHALNIRLFPPQLIHTATHAENRVVIVDNTLAPGFAQLVAHIPTLRHVIVNGPIADDVRAALAAPEHIEGVHDYAELIAGQPDSFDWPEDLDENSASSMCYTSGTTGNPKGVAYSHRSNYLHAMAVPLSLDMRQGDRMLVVVPLFHANAWGFPYAAMMSGSSLVLPDRYLQAAPLAQMIEQLGVTCGAGVPTIWNDLLHHLESTPTDVSTCRLLMVGGAAAPLGMMQSFDSEFGIRIVHGWGMTEMSPVGTLSIPPARVEAGTEEFWDYARRQGRLLPGVEARLADGMGGFAPWDGESVGELQVRGPWITGSYYANGSESEGELAEMDAKFEDGWLCTGDVGTLTPDAFFTITDRAKDVIKSGGEWISSVDLENALMAHPDIREASVVGVPDEKWGERPLATVVLKEGSAITPAELKEWMGGKVARWQVPERWAVIDEVPKTSVGKFDKKVLRQRYGAGELEVQQVE